MSMVTANGSPILSSSVLVLNRSYVAVRVVDVRRAFVLLYRSTAEVIHVEDGRYANYDLGSWCELSELWYQDVMTGLMGNHGDWVRTVRLRIHVPRIIRLLGFDQPPRHSVRLNRKNVFARDGNQCQYCGETFPNSQLSFDHVKPRSRGGTTSWENVVTCCLTCNSRKGDRTPQEAGMRLKREPSKPSHNPILKVKLGNPRYRVWQPFLSHAPCAIDVV
jgi:5-methylcytosine-specific restriction endonuclease McrA